MKHVFNHRFFVFWLAGLAVVGWYWATDPDGGAETASRLQSMAWIAVFAGPAYWIRRAFAEGARASEFRAEALKGNVAAAIVYAALILATVLILMTVALVGTAHAGDGLPERARALLPALQEEQARLWPDHPAPATLGALIEQETCPALTGQKCWNPRTELKTSREYGFGLGQFTRTARFDKWRELRRDYADLSAWTWANRYDARLQLRAVVLDGRDCWRWVTRLTPPGEAALAFCDAAYNGGRGGLLSDRRLCAAKKGCDPDKWFGNVELTSAKSKARRRGYGMSFFAINRAHVRNVMTTRRARYEPYFAARTG